MVIYAMLLIWVLLCSRIESMNISWGGEKLLSGRALYILLTFLPLWFVMAFRDVSVGTDTYANASFFVSAAEAPSISYIMHDGFWNAGINVISYLVGFFDTSMQMYIFYSSSIILLGFALFIYKISSKVWISTFLLLTLNLYFISFNASRQFIAIAIAINAFVLIHKNSKRLIGWGLFLLAVWIHNSILSFVPAILGLWLVKHCRSYIRLYMLSIAGALLVFVSVFAIANIFSSLFPHYEMYTQGTNGDNLIENTGGGKIIVVYIVLGCILLMYYWKQKVHHLTVNNTIFDAFIPGAIFCIVLGIGFASNTMMNRIVLPYECFFICLIPCVQTLLKPKMQLLFSTCMILGMGAYYFLWVYANLGNVLPYKTWLL